MSNTPTAAARVTDNVTHSEAQEYRFWGAVGTIAAVVVGVAVAAGLGVLEVASFGAATPLVIAGGVLLAGGMTAVLSGQVADVAADAGRKVIDDEGPIVTGIPSILIGPEKHAAAHLGSYASCKRHKHGGASTMQYAKDIAEDVVGGLIKDNVSLMTGGLFGGGQFNPVADWNQGIKDADQEHNDLEQILQGSSSVFYGMGGKKYHAARIGDQGTCGFTVGHGCLSVIIGGETVTEGKIGTGDDPDKHITDLMKEWGGKAALAGIVLMTLPAGIAALAEMAATVYIFSQVQGAIDENIKDPETRHKVDLAITVLTLGYGAAKGHGGAPEDGEAAGGGETAKDGEGAGSGGGAGEPVGESGRGPADGGGESVEDPSGTAEKPASADPADNTGKGEADSPGDPVRQFGESNGGEKGDASGEQADNTTEPERPPAEDKPAEDKDPEAEQAAKDKAFQKRSAGRTQAVREGVSNKVRKNDPNYAASEFTPAEGNEMAEGAGQYDPSVSGESAPRYGPIDPATGQRVNPTESGTGTLADTTHPINEPNQHKYSRATDSEIKQMEAFKRDLDTNPNMRGTQDIYSDWRDPCTSCKDAARRFNNDNAGRAKVRIHSPNGSVFEEGGRPLDPPLDSEGGGGTKPPPEGPGGSGQGDPLMQFSSRDGGAPGKAPPEQAEDGSTGAQKPATTAAGEGNPTVPLGESPGGEVEGETGESSSESSEPVPLRTGAERGLDPTEETVRVGTVRMEEHPDYAKTIQKIKDAGFEIREKDGAVPHVAVRDVVAQKGGPSIRVEKFVEVSPGMRFLDLEHELGHVEQLTNRFKEGMPMTERALQRENGRLDKLSNKQGLWTDAQDAVSEYHNRLEEWLRLKSRGADEGLLGEHAKGVETARTDYRWKGQGKNSLPQAAWAKEHFPEIRDLERQFNQEGGDRYAR